MSNALLQLDLLAYDPALLLVFEYGDVVHRECGLKLQLVQVLQGLGAGALGGTLDEALPQPVDILMLHLQGFDLFLLEHLRSKRTIIL